MTTALAFYSMPTQWLGLMLRDPLRGHPARRGGMIRRVPDQPDVAGAREDVARHMLLPVAHARPRALRRVHADRALGDARDARRGLHPHRAREGPRNRGRSCASTRCGTRCCRSTTLVALSLGYIVAGAILDRDRLLVARDRPRRRTRRCSQRDYPMLQGAFLVLTVSVVFFNLIADLLYFKLDPRITEVSSSLRRARPIDAPDRPAASSPASLWQHAPPAALGARRGRLSRR